MLNVEINTLESETSISEWMISVHFIGYKNRLILSCTGSEGWELESSCSRGSCIRQVKLCSFSDMPVSNIFFVCLMVSVSPCLALIIRTKGLLSEALWALYRRLHLAPLLCTHRRLGLPPLNLCLGTKLPWATSTPAHVLGAGLYFSSSDTQEGNYTFFPSKLIFLSVRTLVLLTHVW